MNFNFQDTILLKCKVHFNIPKIGGFLTVLPKGLKVPVGNQISHDLNEKIKDINPLNSPRSLMMKL